MAEQIVAQINKRAPFIGVSDFINRRLVGDNVQNVKPINQTGDQELSYSGALTRAILDAELNGSGSKGFRDFQPLFENDPSKTEKPYGEVLGGDLSNNPNEDFTHASAHLTQGKLLQTIGGLLTARSDTFKIRAYGESRSASGEVLAQATCEAVVQRNSPYLDLSDPPETLSENLTSDLNKKLGRTFKVVSFRWINKNEK